MHPYAPTILKMVMTLVLFWVTLYFTVTGAAQLTVVLMTISTVMMVFITIGQYYCDEARNNRE